MSIYPPYLDSALIAFCEEYGLQLATKYKDSEVRSIDVVDDQGASYQIWIEGSEPDWVIKCWDKHERSDEIGVQERQISRGLRDAYQRIEIWISADGHSRNPS